jgi:hypothetical protein
MPVGVRGLPKLLDWRKEFKHADQQDLLRHSAVIANFKTSWIMHIDYRQPLATFPERISAVVALRFCAAA